MESIHSPLAGYREKRAKGETNLSETSQTPKTPEEEFFGKDVDVTYETTAGEIHKRLDLKEAELKRQQEEIINAQKTKEQAKLSNIKARSDAKTAKELEKVSQKLETAYNKPELSSKKNNAHLRLVTSEPDARDQENFTALEEKFFAEGKERARRGELGYELENDEPIEIKVGDLKPSSEVKPKVEKEKPRKAA